MTSLYKNKLELRAGKILKMNLPEGVPMMNE